MTAPGRYAASDGSFAKSAGGAAARGGVLIAIAVVIGLALLAWGFDSGDSDAALPADVGDNEDAADDADDGSDDVADDGAAADAADDSADAADDGDGAADDDNGDAVDDDGDADPTTTVAVRPPSEVQVAVLNGAGVGGLAGDRQGVLGALGYVATAGNAATRDIADSTVYYTSGYAEEAKAVATALSGDAGVLAAAPADPGGLADETGAADAAAADIIVVLGTDEQLR
ncbi:MAG: LytR C-terminal domain-containing protein [Actinomycetota bacterium]